VEKSERARERGSEGARERGSERARERERERARQRQVPSEAVHLRLKTRQEVEFAALRSIQDLLLNKTLLSLFSFILPLPEFSRVASQAACHRAAPWTPVMRELPLTPPLRPCGIMACIHRCRNATRSAVHESGATPSLKTSRHLPSTPQISLCRPVHRLPPNAAFFEAICW
jgi:hypothetical protein